MIIDILISNPEELLPRNCFEIYAVKLASAIETLARTSNDIHAWNAIRLYAQQGDKENVENEVEYLARCEESYGGKVKVFVKPLNKYQNDFSRPLPFFKIFGVSYFNKVILEYYFRTLYDFHYSCQREIYAKICVIYKRFVELFYQISNQLNMKRFTTLLQMYF